MPDQRIIPDRIHADDAELEKWFDQVFEELGAYNTFPQVVAIVSDALARFAREEADEEERDGQAEVEVDGRVKP